MPLTPAVFPGSGPTLLFRSVLAADAAQIDASGIAQGFAHLLILVVARTDQAVVTSGGGLRFNADAGANYDRELIRSSAGVASGNENLGTVFFDFSVAGATADANVFGMGSFFVPFYAGTLSKNVVGSVIICPTAGVGTNQRIDEIGGRWRNTAAITEVTLVNNGGTVLKAGSAMDIYGLS